MSGLTPKTKTRVILMIFGVNPLFLEDLHYYNQKIISTLFQKLCPIYSQWFQNIVVNHFNYVYFYELIYLKETRNNLLIY